MGSDSLVCEFSAVVWSRLADCLVNSITFYSYYFSLALFADAAEEEAESSSFTGSLLFV